MNKNISELIRSLRLVMVIGLVFVHFGSYPGESLDPFVGVVNTTNVYASSINSFFTYFFLCSVPVLSMISGYLFSYNGIDPYPVMLRKKLKTLILPSITWTSTWLLLAFVLYSLGKASNQFTYYDQGFADYSLLNLLNGIIGITEAPFAFQFWFVHDLVLSLIFSPVLVLAIKKAGKFFVILPFVLWAIDLQPVLFFNFKVLAFFVVGLYIGLSGYKPEIPARLLPFNLSIPVFVVMVLVRIYLPALYGGHMPAENIYELLLRVVGSVAIITLALNIRLYLPVVYRFFVNSSGYAFYLHAFHFPLVILVKQALYMTGLFQGESGLIVLWAATILLTVIIALLSAQIMHKVFPPMYRFLNGQRAI